jgi:hypothetical protein
MLKASSKCLLVVFLSFGLGMWFEALSVYAQRFLNQAEAGRMEDYVDFYAAGRMVVDGHAGQIYDLEAIGRVQRLLVGLPADSSGYMPFSNPPFVALAYAPLSLLSLGTMSLVVAALQLLLIGGCSIALVKLVMPSSRAEGVLLVAGFWSLWPLIIMFALGQQTMVLFLGFLAWVWLETSGHERSAGAALALLLIKPHLAVIPAGVLVWKHRWLTLQGFLATGLVFALVSVVVSGPHVLIGYPQSLLNRAAWDHFELGHKQIFYGWDGFFWQFVPWGSPVHYGLVLILSVVTVAVMVQLWRGEVDVHSRRFFYAASATILATILVSPHLLLHDLMLVAASLALSARACRLQTGELGIWVPAAVVAWLTMTIGPLSGLNIVTPVIALLLVVNAVEATTRGALQTVRAVRSDEVARLAA